MLTKPIRSRLTPALGVGLGFFTVLGVVWVGTWAATGEQVSWFRPADDAYYYFQVAENAASGYGLTVDRINPTNGFHPLWLALLIPIFALASNPITTGLTLVQLLILLLLALSAGLICRLALERFSPTTALLSALVLALPEYRNLAFTGVEAAVTLLVLLLVAREMAVHPERLDPEPHLADGRLGLLLAAAMLARLDGLFLLVAVAALLTFRAVPEAGGPAARRLGRLALKGLAVFWPVLVLVVPYLAWNILVHGHLVPVSGVLKSSFPEAVFQPDHFAAHWPYMVLLALGAAGGARALARADPEDRLRLPVVLLAAAGISHLGYTLAFMPAGVFAWHFVSYLPPGLLGLGYLVEPVVGRLGPRARWGVVAATTLLMLAGVGASLFRRLPDGELALRAGTRLATREAAGWVQQNLPADAILAMKDSGAFTFYSRRRVVNLDGVINNFEYQERKCRGELTEYLEEQGVRYLAQHRVPLAAIEAGYGQYAQVIPCLLPEGRDAVLALDEELEVYRGRPYWSGDLYGPTVIWRLPEPARLELKGAGRS